MKNIKITLILLLLIVASSCTDFLSEKPDNRTEINTPEKISEVLVYAYPQASYFDIAETMSDNVSDSGDQFGSSTIKNTENYNWAIQTENNDTDSQATYWDACYAAIAQANTALQAINELGNPSSLNPQKGEALLARAYSHFMLVSLWSKRYNPATAQSTMGIPIIAKPETELTPQYKRNSVQEVFDFIQKDIEEGLLYVNNNYKEPKFHFNKDAAKAFAARFYLIKGDWNRVLELSQDLPTKPIDKLRNFASYETLSPNDQRVSYGSSAQQTNLLIVSANSVVGRSAGDSRYYLSNNKFDEIFSANSNPYGKPWFYNFYSFNGSLTLFVPKFYEYFKYTNLAAGIGEPYINHVLISNDEFFLNRIEAHVMTGQISLANEELDYFLSTRTSGYNPATDKITQASIVADYPVIANEFTPFYTLTAVQTSYIKAIAEAKRRDFVHEGMRWFDVKRFNIVVNHDFDNKPIKVLTKDDNRRALQIPIHAVSNGIESNPR